MKGTREKITAATIARTVCLVLALVNQVLSVCGRSPLPIEDETVSQILTLVMTTAASLAAWWKNNSFTQKAIFADRYLRG